MENVNNNNNVTPNFENNIPDDQVITLSNDNIYSQNTIPMDLDDSMLSNRNIPNNIPNNNQQLENIPNQNQNQNPTSTPTSPNSTVTTETQSQEQTVQQPTNTQQPDYTGYTQTALFATSLKESGLDLFGEEFNKEITPQDFVSRTENYINTTINNKSTNIINSKLQEIGDIAYYVKHLMDNNPEEQINPALQARKIINFNIEDENVTENDLLNVIGAMYQKQVSDPSLIPSLLENDKNKGLDYLKNKANISKDFHKKYEQDIIANIENNKKIQSQRQQEQIQQEQSSFANSLKNTTEINGIAITDKDRSQIFDMMYNKDQIITYKDDQGNTKQDYLTKYEVMMYNTVNDPQKLITLSYLLANNFNLDKFKNKISNNVNQTIFNAIENNKNNSGIHAQSVNNQTNQQYSNNEDVVVTMT